MISLLKDLKESIFPKSPQDITVSHLFKDNMGGYADTIGVGLTLMQYF